MGQSIPLAWDPNLGPCAYAIEVYPGATLQICGLTSSGYKGTDRQPIRQGLLGALRAHAELPSRVRERMPDNDDVLHAAVCVLAGADFCRGECIQPTDFGLARQEGWIWVRRPD